MGSGEEFPPTKGTCLPKADLPLGVNQSQKAMREVFPFNTSPGTLKPFPCTKNTALKVSTKLQNSALYGIDYLLPKSFLFSMKLSSQSHVLSLVTLAWNYPLKEIIYPKLKWNCLVKNSHGRTESLKTLPLSTNLYASLSFCECRQCLSNWEVQTWQMAHCQNR